MQVAQTILEQLGGGRFLVMTGAKHLLGDETSLRFKLPMRSKDGSNVVKITLTAMDDDYIVETMFVRGTSVKPCSYREGVYGDTLAPVFETLTGLRVSL